MTELANSDNLAAGFPSWKATAERKTKAEQRYGDIIGLSRPQPTRAAMPVSERAAQFAPFAALSGFEALLRRTEHDTSAQYEAETESNPAAGEC